MKFEWKDLPETKNCFTSRNTMMFDLQTKKIVGYYSANTKIAVVQKCVTELGAFYRTESAKDKSLDWAFKAAALGLPNEKAPSAPSYSLNIKSEPVISHSSSGAEKQKTAEKVILPEDGEARTRGGWIKKLFRRKNG